MNYFKSFAAIITIFAAFFIMRFSLVFADVVEVLDPITEDSDFSFESVSEVSSEVSEDDLVSDPVLLDQALEDFEFELEPLETTETTEPIITDIADLNILLDYAVNDLTLRINAAALEHETEITFPEDFSLNAATIVGEVIYTDVDQLFRHFFITKILEYLGIPEDSPLYDILYDVVGSYYDELTAQDEQNNDSAVGVVLLSMCGFALSLSVLKWVMF